MKHFLYTRNTIKTFIALIMFPTMTFGSPLKSHRSSLKNHQVLPCTTAQVGCWMEGIETSFMSGVDPITIQLTETHQGGATFCEIKYTSAELNFLCAQKNRYRLGSRAAVLIQACTSMSGWGENGYYDDNLQVCFIPIHL